MEVGVLSVEMTGREQVGHSRCTSIVRRTEVKSGHFNIKGERGWKERGVSWKPNRRWGQAAALIGIRLVQK